MSRGTAIAHANIALAKYWGKSDVERNLPAVPSLSMTLGALSTTTTVVLDGGLERDVVVLGGAEASGRPRERVVALLDEIRQRAGVETRARVTSKNDFPTAAGLASSASGFAALALAASAATGLDAPADDLSAIARAASVSAARSSFGGFVALPAGAERAERVAPADHWDLRMVVALTQKGPKSVGSTEGMLRTAKTSPYYDAWVKTAPTVYAQVREAISARDVSALGEAMERSALMMHASMYAASPPIVYFKPATLAVMDAVAALRRENVPAYYTMDAGPHVKILTTADEASRVAEAIDGVDGVDGVIDSGIGGDARLVTETEDAAP